MAVGDFQTPQGHYEDTVLPFEGFMEALIRIAAQKALPTEEEMRQEPEGSPSRHDAGAYLAQLKAADPVRFANLMKERAGVWCSALPVAGFERRVQCTIEIFGHAVEGLEGRPLGKHSN